MSNASSPLLTTATARRTKSGFWCIFFSFVATLSTAAFVAALFLYPEYSELLWEPDEIVNSTEWTFSNTTSAPYHYDLNHNQSILLWQVSIPESSQYVGCKFIDGSKLSTEELRNHSTFDVVIFNASADYKAHPLPIPRLPQQRYIYALDRPLTPAFRRRHNVSELAQFFNMTFSYKLDSDIPWQPYTIAHLNRKYAPYRFTYWQPMRENISDFMKAVYVSKYNSTQLLALTVMEAPCNRTSHKYKLLQSIGDLMQVDIYGDCGALSLPQPNKLPTFDKRVAYKFYFAFEEELCTDYVSPYFYEALMNGIVPVVFGGADYTRFAPPNSYIDASDFKTVHGLFDYLQYLQQNVEEYIKYFTFRQHYRVEKTQNLIRKDLCDAVNRRLYGKEFSIWWQNNKCYEAKPNTFIRNEINI